MKLANTFKRVVTTTFIWLAVAIFLAEEWLWDSLAWIMKLFSVFPAIEWLEEKLVSLSPKAIMVVFLVPIIALEPLKVIALTSIAEAPQP